MGLCLLLGMTACSAVVPPQKPTATATPLPATLTPTRPAPSPSPSPWFSPAPSPTGEALVSAPTQDLSATPLPSPTPPPIDILQSKLLRSGVAPQTYLQDTCQYLRLRWDPNNSPPGTVIVPIMFHSIVPDGRPITEDTTITESYFVQILEHAKSLGFQTITTAQAADFLEKNAKIPQLSLLMIVDDRRPGVVQRFLPYLEKYNWTLTLGWIVAQNTAQDWANIEGLNASGRLDVQSHGYNHIYIVPTTPEADVRHEIFDPIPVLLQHFGQRPTAFIWPGGNFTDLSVQLAHEAGYSLGFTAYSRGPLMFNWIPLGQPEQAVKDPLMVLPRFWSTAATLNLDQAVQFSQQAAAQAQANRQQEQSYLSAYCPQATPTP